MEVGEEFLGMRWDEHMHSLKLFILLKLFLLSREDAPHLSSPFVQSHSVRFCFNFFSRTSWSRIWRHVQSLWPGWEQSRLYMGLQICFFFNGVWHPFWVLFENMLRNSKTAKDGSGCLSSHLVRRALRRTLRCDFWWSPMVFSSFWKTWARICFNIIFVYIYIY